MSTPKQDPSIEELQAAARAIGASLAEALKPMIEYLQRITDALRKAGIAAQPAREDARHATDPARRSRALPADPRLRGAPFAGRGRTR